MSSLLTPEQARQRILTKLPRTCSERVALAKALGRILHEDVHASEDAPRFDNAARDGYAVRWAELAASNFCGPLTLVGSLNAGESARGVSLGKNQCVKIMTGAPMPADADTVIMREYTRDDAHEIFFEAVREDHEQGSWVRKQGSFVRAQSTLVRAGVRLRAGDLGALASANRAHVSVAREPVVAIICSGDELAEVGTQPAPEQIINVNAPMLVALTKQAGATPLLLPTSPDRLAALKDTYAHALRSADMIISSGGVSMGDRDHVREVLTQVCGGMEFWKIGMKPGKPLAFGLSEDQGKPCIGLPGNPASSFVCFHQFVLPTLWAMQGATWQPLMLKATLEAAVQSTPKRAHYVCGQVRTTPAGELSFKPVAEQDSGNPLLLAHVSAFAILELGRGSAQPGEQVSVQLLTP